MVLSKEVTQVTPHGHAKVDVIFELSDKLMDGYGLQPKERRKRSVETHRSTNTIVGDTPQPAGCRVVLNDENSDGGTSAAAKSAQCLDFVGGSVRGHAPDVTIIPLQTVLFHLAALLFLRANL